MINLDNIKNEELKSIAEKINLNIDKVDSVSLLNSTINEMMDCIHHYFFNRKAEIMKIYSAIKSDGNSEISKYPKISTVNILVAYNLYGDYLDGYTEFIVNICKLNDEINVNIESLNKKVSDAEIVDENLILNLTNGYDITTAPINKTPGDTYLYCTIDKAMENIELISRIEETIHDQIARFAAIEPCVESEKYDEIKKRVRKHFTVSILQFNILCIDKIFDCYNKILQSLNGVVSTENVETPKYQVF